MAHRLVIVESPAKCSKIQSFLGDGYRVIATMGHIRALQQKLDAVGIENGWNPTYEELATKKEAISKLKKAAKEAAEVWLATDDDREGEGIAWHVCHLLKLNPLTTPRIVFHEITRPAIQAAVAAPRRLDMNRVNAQQARAMLDMLVGFTISRVLWKRVAPKLSAGRCQTPALRLVAERDAEISGHAARNYWTLRGQLGGAEPALSLSLSIKADGEHAEDAATTFLKSAGKSATVKAVKERLSTSAAPAPLITSTLQQEASALHGLSPKQSMAAAQKLYEAGHITYMRTDNPQLSVEACQTIREQIRATWGDDFVGPEGQHQLTGTTTEAAATEEKPKAKKTTKKAAAAKEAVVPQAQAAHEAIRPTHPEVTEITDMEHAHQVVYRLVWRRAMQSQMAAAKTHVRTATLTIEGTDPLVWTAEQTKPAFEGWRAVEQTEKSKETAAAEEAAWTAWTPLLTTNSVLAWSALTADEVFTKPPGRYTEATLIRELERRGIGRPSTFASLVTTLFEREYVEKTNIEGKPYETRHLTRKPATAALKETKETHKSGAEKNKIRATPLGVSVTECLQRDFQDLFAYEFTAKMEGDLDTVSNGAKEWKSVLQETWDTYKDRYSVALAEKGEARTQTVGGSGEGGEGVKVIQTKRGPLLVRPKADGSGDEFAPLPAGVTATNAATKLTPDLINEAFEAAAAAKNGEVIGVWEEQEMLKKKGPFGFYVQCGDLKVPFKAEDTEETLRVKLDAKKGAYERKVGDYVIKQGPYGLYFMKVAAAAAATTEKVGKGKAKAAAPAAKAKGKPRFVSFPKDRDPDAATEKELDELYAAPPVKKTYVRKPKTTADKN